MTKPTEPNAPYPPEDLGKTLKSLGIMLGVAILVMLVLKFFFGL